jgi:hypothetical protein
MKKVEFYFDKFLSQTVEKEVRLLFVSYLIYLEELMEKGSISEQEYSVKRKEILDKGNSAIRIINEQLAAVFSNLKID